MDCNIDISILDYIGPFEPLWIAMDISISYCIGSMELISVLGLVYDALTCLNSERKFCPSEYT